MQQAEDKNLVVRRRRGEEHTLRRGSIKSRIFQMSKRRKKEQPTVSHPDPQRENPLSGRAGNSGKLGGPELLGTPQTFNAQHVTRLRPTPDSLQLTRPPSRPPENLQEPRAPPRGRHQILLSQREGRHGNGQGITHKGPIFRPYGFFMVSDGFFCFFKVPGCFFTVLGGFSGFSRFHVGFYCSRSVFMAPGLVFIIQGGLLSSLIVPGWFASKLSAAGAK